MLPQIVKYRLWQLALRRDPQTATYSIRTASTTLGTADTFETYNLLRVTYRELTQDELTFAGASLADQYRMYTIYQVDLDNSNAPAPQKTYELTFTDSTTWIIENVKVAPMTGTAYECLCRLAR